MMLSAQDRTLKAEMQQQLRDIVKEEEVKWKQRAKEIDLLEGDRNIKYYHAKANGRRRKTTIFRLVQEEGVIEGQNNLKVYITDFYKKLFGHPDNSSIRLLGDGLTKISTEDSVFLKEKFTINDLKEAVFGMATNKAAGPDGFNVEFYQKHWDIVKKDLFGLLQDFQEGRLDVGRLNYGVITLVPKGKDADKIQKFRPICLLNVTLNFLTKVLVNKLTGVIQKVVKPTQTAFLKGRYIMEGVCVLHEVLNDLHVKNKSGVLFKIDFEKAFDKIKWPFLYQILEQKGFPSEWIDMVMKIVTSGEVGIRINGEVGPYFSTYQGLRQGDPLSPLLFDIAVDVLAILIERAQEHNLLGGLASDLITGGGVAILQYADDTVLMFEDNLEHARNLKIILCLFEQLSGLKINFHKSDIYCVGSAVERSQEFENILTCNSSVLPMKYLGVPVNKKRLKLSDWRPSEEKMAVKLCPWQGKNLVMGGRVSLINSSVTSVPLYMLSFYVVPSGPRESMDRVRKGFLWSGDKDKKKYHLVKWETVCMPKEQGGLGILDLELMNISLISKWLWKLFNEDGLWQQILTSKYLRKITLCQVSARPGDSHFWQGLMEVKPLFWPCCTVMVGNGEKTSFWEDHWVGDMPLAKQFPRLFSISLNKLETVKNVFANGMNSLRFRRTRVGELGTQWAEMFRLLDRVALTETPDKLRWKLTESGVFSVKSLYLAMQVRNTVPYRFMWKVKIPLRVKTFLWLVLKKSILTRDVLLHRGGKLWRNVCFVG